MGAITISRQLGSHGARIARGVALKLGWPIADKSTINNVIKQYGLVHLDDIYGDEPPTFWDLFDRDSIWTIEWMNNTIRSIAAQGDAVVLGRGGFAVLGGYADTLHVFIKAPLDVRAHRISLRDDIHTSDAQALVEADDKARAKFTRLIYSKNWADEKNFDLVIDTGEMSDAEAMDKIIDAYMTKAANPPQGPRVEDLTLDPVLADTITAELG